MEDFDSIVGGFESDETEHLINLQERKEAVKWMMSFYEPTPEILKLAWEKAIKTTAIRNVTLDPFISSYMKVIKPQIEESGRDPREYFTESGFFDELTKSIIDYFSNVDEDIIINSSLFGGEEDEG